MHVVMFQGADQLSVPCKGVCGALLYYADREDAVARHKFVNTLVVETTEQRDMLGKPWRVMPPDGWLPHG